jgi:hypothetical protein
MLLVAAIEPAATGIILLISPALFGWLVLGSDLFEAGQTLGRLAGIVLISLTTACWPPRAPASAPLAAVHALLVYNLLATIFLIYVGVGGRVVGLLLWPAVVLHAILTMLIIRAWLAADQVIE